MEMMRDGRPGIDQSGENSSVNVNVKRQALAFAEKRDNDDAT